MSVQNSASEMSEQARSNPHDIPLAKIDVSDSTLYEHDVHDAFFRRLREEDPVHYLAESPFGPFWSITRFADIQYVDSHHDIFSSEPSILIGDHSEDIPLTNFIQSDPPVHDVQRKAVQNVVAPSNLAELEPIIRSRAASILDRLPVGETSCDSSVGFLGTTCALNLLRGGRRPEIKHHESGSGLLAASAPTPPNCP